MQRSRYLSTVVGLGAAALVGTGALPAAGQQSTAGQVKQDAKETGQRVKQGAEHTGQHMKQSAEQAGQRVEQGAERQTGSNRPLSDGWLTAKTKLAFFADDKVSGTDINVDTSNGVVTLRGQVNDAAEKARAVQIAKGIEGVKSVQDRLTVGSQSGRQSQTGGAAAGGGAATSQTAPAKRDDEQVARQVRQAIQSGMGAQFRLEGDTLKGQRDNEIKVEVDDGVVTLDGKVQNVEDIVKAAQAARKVPGVRSVKTNIESGQPS
jgi:hyperosmotically inducible periplasmic protein